MGCDSESCEMLSTTWPLVSISSLLPAPDSNATRIRMSRCNHSIPIGSSPSRCVYDAATSDHSGCTHTDGVISISTHTIPDPVLVTTTCIDVGRTSVGIIDSFHFPPINLSIVG